MLAEHAIFDRAYAEQANRYIHDQHDYTDTKSYIALCHKTPKGKMPHRFVKTNDINEAVVSDYLGEDCYFSMSSFVRHKRKVEWVRKIPAVWVDLDCYKLGLDPDWVLRSIEINYIDTGNLPPFNWAVHSGQGLYLIWWIEPVPGAKPAVVGLWRTVMGYIYETLREYGADPQCIDITRVLRVPGSINLKNGARVTVDQRHDYRFALREIAEYLPEKIKTDQIPRRRGQPAKREVKVVSLHNRYTLHYARLQDLLKLCAMRQWKLSGPKGLGKRELVLFLYRYWSLCFTGGDKDKALEDTKALNNQFDVPLPDQEVVKATRSAEQAYETQNDEEKNRKAKEMGYPGAGYNYSNKRLVRLLDITAEEQKNLSTIIDYEEKQHRRRKARREAGVKPRDEYLEEQKKRSEDKLEALREAIKKNPLATNKELGERLGVTDRRIRTLRKKL
ncbi:replication protein [Alicyclobacillus mengziensis]|uniref:Replication protein n=1 Tax=Alicyclobacillus mengziensis TaxID=2931921 RepID=A0A9X7VV25_9BACL|nr:replication protein [Alicyclobacillus mengziensis]QSO45472.1 replication protein [Alicyclobacillus mengziensis]